MAGLVPVQKESATVLPVLDLHVTVLVCVPLPHVAEQVPQVAESQEYVAQAGVLQACEVAGLVPVHMESETVLPELSLH